MDDARNDSRIVLGIDEATTALLGATVTGVEFVQGDTEDADYLVVKLGTLTLYANGPTVYDDAPKTTADDDVKLLDRVQVTSALNGGRYLDRWATVIGLPTGKSDKYTVQLDKFTRGLEPMDGCLYLTRSEIS